MLYIIHMYINSVCTFHVCEHMQLLVTTSIPLLFGGGASMCTYGQHVSAVLI